MIWNASKRALLAIGISVALVGCGRLHGMARAETPVSYQAPADRATVVFARASRYASAIRFYVVDAEGRFVAGTQARMHGVVALAPGEYMLYAISENVDPVHAILAPGRTYVIETRPRMGWGKARVTAAPVRRNGAEWNRIAQWLQGTRQWIPVPAEGQAWAAERSDDLRRYIERANQGWTEQTEEWRQAHTLLAEDGLTPQELASLGLQ